MKRYLVEIEVDESILSYLRDDGFSTEDIIEAEFVWLQESGIFLQNIKSLEQ